MSISVPTGDDFVDNLIGELTILVKKYGSQGRSVQEFIIEYASVTFIDRKTSKIHTFKELADGLVFIIEGITNEAPTEPKVWESNPEDLFYQKDDNDPADWWK